MTTNSSVIARNESSSSKQVVVGARITEELLQALNVRLKVDGYDNIGQLLRDYAVYKFPKYSKDEQVEKPWTEKLWIYDLRTNKHFTLRTNPLKDEDLQDFIKCYNPKNRHNRKENERFQMRTYDQLLKRDKVSLDIFWLKDESLEDSENLPAPDVIAKEITENLEAALQQFAAIQDELSTKQ